MDLSIVIVNYKTKELTANCIDSVIRETKGVSYEIILVDNASNDGSCEYLKVTYPGIRVIENKENLGIAKANNQGIKASRGRYILMLNSDTIVLDDCLAKCLKFAKSRNDAGIIGCKVLDKNRSLQYSCYHKPNLLTELVCFTKDILKASWDPVNYFKYMLYWKHDSVKEVECLSSCFFWIDREIVKEAEYFDENIFMYYDDTEYCIRLRERTGYKVYYYPFAEIIHLKGSRSSDLRHDPRTPLILFRSAQYYFEKSYGTFYRDLFVKLCSAVWRAERLALRLYRSNEKIGRKYRLLDELIGCCA